MARLLDTLWRTVPSLTGAVWLVLANAAQAQPPAACDCLWQGSFNRSQAAADLIVSGSIVGRKGNSVDFDINHIHLDRSSDHPEFRSIIRLWADNGSLCRPPVETFPPGSRWLMALKKIDSIPAGGFNPNTPNISYGREQDYFVSACGANWLALHDGYVTGNLVNGRRWNWQNEEMNPVLVELIEAYVDGVVPEAALIEAAKPQTETKKLMEQTRQFLREQ